MHTKFGAELSWAQNSALNFQRLYVGIEISALNCCSLKIQHSTFICGRWNVGAQFLFAQKSALTSLCAQKSAFNCQHSKVATLNCRAFKIRNSIVCAQSQRSYVGTQLSCAQKLALKYTHLKRLALKSRCSSVDAQKFPCSSVERSRQRSNVLRSKVAGLDCCAFKSRRSNVLR